MPAPGPKRKASTQLFLLCALLLAPLCATAASSPPVARSCLAACERTVEDRTLRIRVCNRCLFHGDARGGWVVDLARQKPFPKALLNRALSDGDWQVVREAAKVLAKRQGASVPSVLAAHLKSVPAQERDVACLTVARVGADQKQSWRKWRRSLSGAMSVAARCERSVKASLELELYGLEPQAAREAMLHLATLFETSPAVAVLDAMKTRPPEADAAPAKVLLAHAAQGGPPVGRLLLQAATEENRIFVNRLVAFYMRELGERAKAAKPTEALARRAVVTELGRYAPLSAPDLEPFLWDDDLTVRLAAAKALAAGEGRSLGDAVRARVLEAKDAKSVDAALQTRWVELLGAAGGRECREGPLEDIARAKAAPQKVRTAAVVGYAGCAGAKAKPLVHKALGSPDAPVRAGGVLAQVELGPVPKTREVVAQALLDPSAVVREAGCTAAGLRRFRDMAEPVALNLEAEEASLRRAAVEALGLLQDRSYAGKVAQRLSEDADQEVRLAAVGALSKMGGAQAAAALSKARSEDPQSLVRREAERALRQMGFAP